MQEMDGAKDAVERAGELCGVALVIIIEKLKAFFERLFGIG